MKSSVVKTILIMLFLLLSSALADSWQLPAHPEGKHKSMRLRADYLEDVYHYNVKNYLLNWDVTDTLNRSISGKVTIQAQAEQILSEFIFDLYDNMVIDSLLYSNTQHQLYPINLSQITRQNNRVSVYLPFPAAPNENFQMQIVYHGQPVGGSLMGLTFSSHGNNNAAIASLGEPEDSRIWWPCKDLPSDKATAEIRIITHAHQLAASNGLLQSITIRPDSKLEHFWKTAYPTSTYLLSLAVSNYRKSTIYYHGLDGNLQMPIEIYAYPELYAQTLEDCSILPEMLSCFGNKFGEYPFSSEKYGIALFNWGGAMENQTCTSYGSYLIDGLHTFDWVMAHELAHQWLGDQVTCQTWKDLWLQEGGASYLENIWYEYKYGEAAYLNGLAKQRNSYFYEDSRTRFPLYDPPAPYLFGRTTYEKGAWIYHMLRYLVGDQAFFDGIKSYLNDPRWSYANATTDQFIDYMDSYANVDLSAFKNEWIYSAGHPQYAWAYEAKDHDIKIQLLQEQRENDQTPFFTTPLPCKIRLASGRDSVLILKPQSRYQVFDFQFAEKISLEEPVLNYREKVLCTTRQMPIDSVDYQLSGRAIEIISTFPNPCREQLTIHFNIADYRMLDDLHYTLYNIKGELTGAGEIEEFKPGYNYHQLNLPALSSGLYLIKIQYRKASDLCATGKFIFIQ